ncbi:MAG: metalloregulator ArsR/SmtB family transcription factor [Eubacteriales bacterium]|nr:metalloregulator ArsR/SmtB family transcription factor [Eubacteriales bacterium]
MTTEEVNLLETDYKGYAAMMKALGDESRVKIFDMLSKGELCACKVLEEFNITQPTLSYHMKILCDCGLVNGRRDGIWMKYTINEEAFERLKCYLNNMEPSSINIECKSK